MRKTNYHTHSHYCDGNGTPEEYVQTAIRKGFHALGFSSHAPLPFETEWTMNQEDLPAYTTEILQLKEKYRDRIQIYLGLELDFIPEDSVSWARDTSSLGLDYTIGSVHMAQNQRTGGYLSIDNTYEEFRSLIQEIFDGDAQAFVQWYYRFVGETAEKFRPDIIGHLDVIKKNNRNREFFTEEESWYREAVFSALEAISRSGAILEVNSGGLSRRRTDTFYPSAWILREARHMNIPVMLNSDVHQPEQMDAFFPEGLVFLREAGYDEIRYLDAGEWKSQKIEI